MFLEHFNGVFSGQVYCGLLSTWHKKIRPDFFQKHCALCDGVLVCILCSRSLVLLIFNFFRRLLL